ncbi:hypothetical protein AB0N09_05940 [Streptomyces erythrochromogenes]|uniref:hypothetical protein n=1 Tax=Streptomyces erythrochromogenes TaxID=285574 RepID=UPI00341A872D
MNSAPETAQEAAGRLAMQIWLDTLAHDEGLAPLRERRAPDSVPVPARLTEVTSASQLREGDLILALDNNARNGASDHVLGRYTVHEGVQHHRDSVRRVVSVGRSVITTDPVINIPAGGWSSCDPDRIGESKNLDTSERINLAASRWAVARLGHAHDIANACHQHPLYDAWHAAYQDAKKQRDESDQRFRARRAAQDAARAPLLAAADGFNAITRETLIVFSLTPLDADELGTPTFPITWFAGADRLTVYLAGLLATGRITSGQHAEALGHLGTLGLYSADGPTNTSETAAK